MKPSPEGATHQCDCVAPSGLGRCSICRPRAALAACAASLCPGLCYFALSGRVLFESIADWQFFSDFTGQPVAPDEASEWVAEQKAWQFEPANHSRERWVQAPTLQFHRRGRVIARRYFSATMKQPNPNEGLKPDLPTSCRLENRWAIICNCARPLK